MQVTAYWWNAICVVYGVIILFATDLFLFFTLDIDECASSPCLHNWTCVNLLSAFQCECAPNVSNCIFGRSSSPSALLVLNVGMEITNSIN